MIIQRIQPSPRLSKLVKCYYYLENTNTPELTDTYFADGCVEAVFSIGWDFFKDGQRENWAKVIGQILTPRNLRITGTGRSFGIWFYPHTFPTFSPVEMTQLNDRALPWDELFPASFAEVVGNCLCDNSLDILIRRTDQFLIERSTKYSHKTTDELAAFTIDYLYNQPPDEKLSRLSSLMGVSPRHLQRTFISKTGLTQKQFLRVLRFQHAMHQLCRRTDVNLTGLAHDSGYFDQAHFIREFKTFTGITPSAFQANSLPINRHFIGAE